MFSLIFCIALVATLAISLVDMVVEEVNESITDRVIAQTSKIIKRRKAKAIVWVNELKAKIRIQPKKQFSSNSPINDEDFPYRNKNLP